MEKEDLIEKYLTGKLNEADRLAFEEKLDNSAELQKQVALNRQIIEGIKAAREEELKAMLNNVTISGPMSAFSGKAALATLSVGVVALILYFSIRHKNSNYENVNVQTNSNKEINTPKLEPKSADIETLHDRQKKEQESQKLQAAVPPPTRPSIKHDGSAAQHHSNKKAAKKDIVLPVPPVDDSDALESLKVDSDKELDSAQLFDPWPTDNLVSREPMEVELDMHNKKYTFHYRCLGNKLFLYGPFVQHLYELIETSKSNAVLYLYYEGSFYYINKQETEIAPLTPVKDSELLSRLNTYRNR